MAGDNLSAGVRYGHRIVRPSFAMKVSPPEPTPIRAVLLACLWLAAKALAIVVGTLALTAFLSLSFPAYAFPIGMIAGFLGFVAWNLLP